LLIFAKCASGELRLTAKVPLHAEILIQPGKERTKDREKEKEREKERRHAAKFDSRCIQIEMQRVKIRAKGLSLMPRITIGIAANFYFKNCEADAVKLATFRVINENQPVLS